MRKEYMNVQALDELLDRLEDKYGNLDSDYGCYVSTDNGSEWLSVEKIVDLIISIDNCYDYE